MFAVVRLTTKQSGYGRFPEGNCWGEEVTLSPWNIRVEMVTSTGKATGDGSTLTAMSCRAGYQSDGLPRGLTKVLTQRSPEMTVSLQTYRMV